MPASRRSAPGRACRLPAAPGAAPAHARPAPLPRASATGRRQRRATARACSTIQRSDRGSCAVPRNCRAGGAPANARVSSLPPSAAHRAAPGPCTCASATTVAPARFDGAMQPVVRRHAARQQHTRPRRRDGGVVTASIQLRRIAEQRGARQSLVGRRRRRARRRLDQLRAGGAAMFTRSIPPAQARRVDVQFPRQPAQRCDRVREARRAGSSAMSKISGAGPASRPRCCSSRT